MSREVIDTRLLFFPSKVQAKAQQLSTSSPSELLLKKSLDTPDWSLENLWSLAAFYHLNMNYEKAMPYYQKLLEWSQNNPEAESDILTSVGHVFLISHFYNDAMNTLKIALKFNPQNAMAHYYLSECWLRKQDPHQALHHLKQFLSHYPNDDLLTARAGRFTAILLEQLGRPNEAKNVYSDLAARLKSWAFEIQAQSYLPILPAINQENKPPEVNLTQDKFYDEEFEELLVYRLLKQKNDIRAELEHWGKIFSLNISRYLKLDPSISATPKKNHRLAIVGDFCAPQASPYLDAIIALARDRSITIITTNGIPDLFKQEEWMRIYPCNKQLISLHHAIVSHSPDLIIYLTVGAKQPALMALASQQLAPTQAVLGTESITSGLKSIQYYLSLEMLESEHAQDFYTEKLIRLKGSPVANVSLPDQFIEQASFQLPLNKNIYLCPLKISDLHIDMYSIFISIIEKDPKGQIFVLSSGHSALDQIFKETCTSINAEVDDRLHILPPMNEHTLYSLIQYVDIVLDPVHIGVQHQAWPLIMLGTPIISLQSAHVSGRYVAGLYQRLGIENTIITSQADYADKAIEMANDKKCKENIAQAIQKNRKQIFKHQAFIQSLAECVDQIIK